MWLVYRRLHGESVDDLQRQLHRRGLVRLRAEQHERADVPAGKRVFWNSGESDDRANGVEVPPSVPAVHVRYVCLVAVVKFDCAESGKGQQGDL